MVVEVTRVPSDLYRFLEPSCFPACFLLLSDIPLVRLLGRGFVQGTGYKRRSQWGEGTHHFLPPAIIARDQYFKHTVDINHLTMSITDCGGDNQFDGVCHPRSP